MIEREIPRYCRLFYHYYHYFADPDVYYCRAAVINTRICCQHDQAEVCFLFRSRQLELEDKHSSLELEYRKYMELKGECLHTETLPVGAELEFRRSRPTYEQHRFQSRPSTWSIVPVMDTLHPCTQYESKHYNIMLTGYKRARLKLLIILTTVFMFISCASFIYKIY